MYKIKKILNIAKGFFLDTYALLFANTVEETNYGYNVKKDLSKHVRPAVIFAVGAILVAIGFFLVWGGLARLDSAATAVGVIALSGNHKTIQHLEGGVIEQILVKEGDIVEEGQDLVILNNSSAKASVHTTISQLRMSKAIEKRLLAELQGHAEIDFSDPILDQADDEVQMLIKNQKMLFEYELKTLYSQLDAIEQRIVQETLLLQAYVAKHKASTSQFAFAQEQSNASEKLYNKELETKTRLLEYRSRVSATQSQQKIDEADIARAKAAIKEAKHNKNYAETDFKQKVAEKYRENHAFVLELEQRLHALQDILARTTIKAPKSGIVTGMQYYTVGGVIAPVGNVMDIVPQDDKLIVEAQVSDRDIESIHAGLEVKMQLEAYKSRLVPRISGRVIYVSADKFSNQSGGSFYHLKAEINEEALKKINTNINLYPGMPVTLFIVRGERTFLQYLMSPILDSFHKAFKEA